jgi:heavy metal sensor kinase
VTTFFRRLPVRLRLTFAFTAAMAVLFALTGVALYLSMSSALLDELDTGIRGRAATLQTDLAQSGFRLGSPEAALVEPTETFVQIVDRSGAVIDSNPSMTSAVLPIGRLRELTGPQFFQSEVAGMTGQVRILAVPTTMGSRPVVALVGGSMSDRVDALQLLIVFLAVGGPVAIALASLAGWLVAGTALRPVEQMRRQAAAISASGLDRRLSLPEADDEVRRLAGTLNEMLARIDTSLQNERRFVDNASHELRTPLTILKTELDLALARPRERADLVAALRSASDEADRLSRLADQLLTISRAQQGQLPVLRRPVPLRGTLIASADLFDQRAASASVRIVVAAPDALVNIDEARIRQAVDNLIDNALRFAPPDSAIVVRGSALGDTVEITVTDSGAGFPAGFVERAFDPFERSTTYAGSAGFEGAGLGLSIVRLVATAHHGTATIDSTPDHGARVTLTLPGTAVLSETPAL